MNREDPNKPNKPNDSIPIDEDLRAIEDALADEMAVNAPAGLAEAVFEASVRELREANGEIADADRPAIEAIERDLPAALAVEAPAGLAERVFAASVRHLPHDADAEPVVGAIGWAQWSGWRYAAAIGLVFVYAALWAKPHVDDGADVATVIAETDLTKIEYLFTDTPSTDIDRGLQEAELLVEELATMTGSDDLGTQIDEAFDSFFGEPES